MKYILLILFTIQNIWAENLSGKYQEILSSKNDLKLQEFKKMIGDSTIVFIPGILAQTVIEDASQPIKFSFLLGDYFRDYLKWCEEIKIKCTRIILESEASVEENSEFLKKELLSLSQPYWVVSHSKGSLEFLNTLIASSEVKNKTKGWISLQSPFWGAVSGNIYLDNKLLNKVASWLFSFLGGSIKAIESISVEQRKDFNEKNKIAISETLKTVNHIHYGSYIEDTEGVETILEFSRDQILKEAGQNDGLVELSSTRYLDSNYIEENGYDHLVTILDLQKIKKLPYVLNKKNKNWKINRGEFLLNIFLLFKR